MARSLLSSITRPLTSLVSPVLRPAIRLAKHPLAPLGMGVAGAVVENVAEKTGLTSWLSSAGVQGVDFVKSSVETGFAAVAGVLDFDEEEPVKVGATPVPYVCKVCKKTGSSFFGADKWTCVACEKTHPLSPLPPAQIQGVGATPNAYEQLHVGCAADKACAPCAKKQLMAKISGALEKLTPEQVKELEVGFLRSREVQPGPCRDTGAARPIIIHGDARPLIPRTHSPAPAVEPASSLTALQNQIAALQTQLTQAQDAVTTQKLADQIAALQAQLAQQQQGDGLQSVIQQILQLKELENAIAPAPTPATAEQEFDPYGYPVTPPWGAYQDQDGGILQDPNGTVYGNPDIDPQYASDPFFSQYGSSTGDPTFDSLVDYSVEGVAGSESESSYTAYPILDENGECEPCKVAW